MPPLLCLEVTAFIVTAKKAGWATRIQGQLWGARRNEARAAAPKCTVQKPERLATHLDQGRTNRTKNYQRKEGFRDGPFIK
jgi:hypothetical protein